MEQANQDPQNDIDSAKRTLVACALAGLAGWGLGAAYDFGTDIVHIQADNHAIELVQAEHAPEPAVEAIRADIDKHQDYIVHSAKFYGGELVLGGLFVASDAASIARRRREEQAGDDQHRGERSE
ncbi:MAG TPA: hypothetical protein VJR27_00785 [Candidatus Saccharimonadales bacterium]|nr:hypothetical protein [Candidatus Saccharimonadales bacterium]